MRKLTMFQDIATNFNTFLTHELNEQQKKAVEKKDGAILVIAGAGSGKTRVITARILNLIINEQVEPRSIVALTFTNKAAKEMRERVRSFLGTPKELPWIGTFHSYCLQLLKKNQSLLSSPFVSILDSDDQQKMLKGILKRNELTKEVTPKELARQISRLKNFAVDAKQIEQMYAMNPLLQELYNAYEHEKRASRCLDFDDLLLEALKLFKQHKEFKKNHHERIRHILVDEYQDTNIVQHDLLKQLAQEKKKTLAVDSLCIVGDEDQSIYSWRGATITNILSIQQEFSDTTIVKIEQNYRSASPILEAANSVIQHNRQRNPKKLWSAKKGKDRIRRLSCLSEYQEADLIAAYFKLCAKSRSQKTLAILYRTHFQSRALEEALIKQSLPYKIIGGTQFYERKEIKDMLAYLRLLVNPFDRAALFRVINVPLRGLGEKFEELFLAEWHTEPLLTFQAIAQKLIDDKKVVKTKRIALEQFLAIFEGLSATADPTETLEQLILKTGYLAHLQTTYDKESAKERHENIKELLNATTHFAANGITTLEGFLDEVALMQENSNKNDDNANVITLMTLHAAKGLEFDYVVLAGLEDGLMPSIRDDYSNERLEEERRLFYVGITRAKERLLLTYARYRYNYRNMTDQVASRFLEEIPTTVPQSEDASYWKLPQIHAYFSEWLGLSGGSYIPSSPVITFSTRTPKKKVTQPKARTKKPTLKKKSNQILPTKNVKPASVAPKDSVFKKNRPVQHTVFGTGIIQEVEERATGKIIVTVRFKDGTKKIDAQFLQKV